MEISFPGGKRVDAKIGAQLIKTDQAEKRGGEGSAPEPFQLFLASIGTCAGIYALRFCESRNLPTDGLRLVQRHEVDPMGTGLAKISIEIILPVSFPDKYRDAIVRAADLCPVKKAIFDPPEIEVVALP